MFLNKLKSAKLNQGMTYVELIVVLSIFAIMSSVSIFSHRQFQEKVQIRNLANDIALRIVQVQKEASLGKLPASVPSEDWKPSYGMHFTEERNDTFFRFVDRDSDGYMFADNGCSDSLECVEEVTIGNGNFIQSISMVGTGCETVNANMHTIAVTFTRPNLVAVIKTNLADLSGCAYTGAQIVVESPNDNTSTITINTSGRVDVQ